MTIEFHLDDDRYIEFDTIVGIFSIQSLSADVAELKKHEMTESESWQIRTRNIRSNNLEVVDKDGSFKLACGQSYDVLDSDAIIVGLRSTADGRAWRVIEDSAGLHLEQGIRLTSQCWSLASLIY